MMTEKPENPNFSGIVSQLARYNEGEMTEQIWAEKWKIATMQTTGWSFETDIFFLLLHRIGEP